MKRPFLVLTALAALAGAPTLGPVDVHLRPMGHGRPQEGIARGVIAAPPERVFRAVVDVEHWHEFMPFLTASDARPEKDGSLLSAQRLDLPFPLGQRHYRIRFRSRVERGGRETVWRTEWSYVPGSGNLTDLRGSWTLTAAPGGTLAVCRLWTDTGVSPSLMDRATEKSLPWIFDGLRQHVRRSRYDQP
ncbi:MAG TPA: SRPBCC family protein [Thermoanaerobaculia bacterium]|nr:SRPBCC family protein [Thermoanaerobaculia bacterium]